MKHLIQHVLTEAIFTAPISPQPIDPVFAHLLQQPFAPKAAPNRRKNSIPWLPNQIVSANYYDRYSSNKWIMRSPQDSLSESQVQPKDKWVVCEGVKFIHTRQSNALEMEVGFGCGMVAACKRSRAINKSPALKNLKRLKFNGANFQNPDTGDTVDSCSRLVLSPEGKMYYNL